MGTANRSGTLSTGHAEGQNGRVSEEAQVRAGAASRTRLGGARDEGRGPRAHGRRPAGREAAGRSPAQEGWAQEATLPALPGRERSPECGRSRDPGPVAPPVRAEQGPRAGGGPDERALKPASQPLAGTARCDVTETSGPGELRFAELGGGARRSPTALRTRHVAARAPWAAGGGSPSSCSA